MGDTNQKFQVEVETGEIMDAELLSVVEIDGKEYAVYSIDNQNGTVDILASYVEKDEELRGVWVSTVANIDIPKNMAGLMLSGILSDTLCLKSPTTTDIDVKVVKKLSKIAGVDYEKYAFDMFKAGTSLDEFSIEEIVNMDFKEFDMIGKRVGIGQVFTLDIDSILSKKDDFLSHIHSTEYDILVLAITDIIKEGSYLIYKAGDKVISEAFSVDASQGVFAEGVVSRKKQLVPNLTTAIRNMQ